MPGTIDFPDTDCTNAPKANAPSRSRSIVDQLLLEILTADIAARIGMHQVPDSATTAEDKNAQSTKQGSKPPTHAKKNTYWEMRETAVQKRSSPKPKTFDPTGEVPESNDFDDFARFENHANLDADGKPVASLQNRTEPETDLKPGARNQKNGKANVKMKFLPGGEKGKMVADWLNNDAEGNQKNGKANVKMKFLPGGEKGEMVADWLYSDAEGLTESRSPMHSYVSELNYVDITQTQQSPKVAAPAPPLIIPNKEGTVLQYRKRRFPKQNVWKKVWLSLDTSGLYLRKAKEKSSKEHFRFDFKNLNHLSVSDAPDDWAHGFIICCQTTNPQQGRFALLCALDEHDKSNWIDYINLAILCLKRDEIIS